MYNNRGVTYLVKDEVARAIEDLNKAIKLKPDYAEAYYNRGVVWSQRQQWEKARLDLTVAKVIGKDSINALQYRRKNIAEFKQIPDINPPEDIAAMLTPP